VIFNSYVRLPEYIWNTNRTTYLDVYQERPFQKENMFIPSTIHLRFSSWRMKCLLTIILGHWYMMFSFLPVGHVGNWWQLYDIHSLQELEVSGGDKSGVDPSSNRKNNPAPKFSRSVSFSSPGIPEIGFNCRLYTWLVVVNRRTCFVTIDTIWLLYC
jgi:hypothetical protein